MTLPQAPSEPLFCPECGARWTNPRATKCWLCASEEQPVTENLIASPRAPHPAEHVGTFSLASLLMTVTIFCVICGTFSVAPGIGMLLMAAVLPALTRMTLIEYRDAKAGRPLQTGARIKLFATSLLFVAVAGVAAFGAFFAGCFAGFFSGAAVGQLFERGPYSGLGTGLVFGMGLGAIAAIATAVLGVRLLSKDLGWRGLWWIVGSIALTALLIAVFWQLLGW